MPEKLPSYNKTERSNILPTVLVFQNGKTVARLTGFEGLSNDPSDPDKFTTNELQLWLANIGAIECSIQQREFLERQGLVNSSYFANCTGIRTYDDDF